MPSSLSNHGFSMHAMESELCLAAMESTIQQQLSGSAATGITFPRRMTGECTMYVAVLFAKYTAKQRMLAVMPVYVGEGIATAGTVRVIPQPQHTTTILMIKAKAMHPATELLNHTITWLQRQYPETRALFIAPNTPPLARLLESDLKCGGCLLTIERTILKKANKRGQAVAAVRGTSPEGRDLIMFKLEPRKKLWDAAARHWIYSHSGAAAPRPRWPGINAFVADLRGVKFLCINTLLPHRAAKKRKLLPLSMQDRAPRMVLSRPSLFFVFKEELVTAPGETMPDIIDVGVQIKLSPTSNR